MLKTMHVASSTLVPGGGGLGAAAAKPDIAVLVLAPGGPGGGLAAFKLPGAGSDIDSEDAHSRGGSRASHDSGKSKESGGSKESDESEGLAAPAHVRHQLLGDVKYDAGKAARAYAARALPRWFKKDFQARAREACAGLNHDHAVLSDKLRVVGSDPQSLSPCAKCAATIACLYDDYNEGVVKGATKENFVAQMRNAAEIRLVTPANFEGSAAEDAWRVACAAFVGRSRRAQSGDAADAKSMDHADAAVVLSAIVFNRAMAREVTAAQDGGSEDWIADVVQFLHGRNDASHKKEEASALRLREFAEATIRVTSALLAATLDSKVKTKLRRYCGRIGETVSGAAAGVALTVGAPPGGVAISVAPPPTAVTVAAAAALVVATKPTKTKVSLPKTTTTVRVAAETPPRSAKARRPPHTAPNKETPPARADVVDAALKIATNRGFGVSVKIGADFGAIFGLLVGGPLGAAVGGVVGAVVGVVVWHLSP